MGNNNINKEKLDKEKPILIWIDKKVNNEENTNYIKYIQSDLNFQVFGFDSVKKSYENLKKLEFIDTYIICSGKKYIKLVEMLKKNINELMICPKIIVFTLNKEKYYKRNFDNKDLSLDDPFYNLGGVEDQFIDIIKFLKKEKTNNTIELDIKADNLIVNKLQYDINKKNKEIKKLKSNDSKDSHEEDYEKLFSSIYNENIGSKVNYYISPEIKNKFNEIDDKILFSQKNIDYIDNEQSPFSSDKLNNISDNPLPSVNKNIINGEHFLFPSENKINKEEKNQLCLHNKNDILNPLKDSNEDQLDIIKNIEDGNKDESIQYNFENISNFRQLILPIFLYIYIANPKATEISKFNHYILTHYSKEQKLVDLINQIFIGYQIPNEITSKYWARAYTAETKFYKEMNKDLRLDKFDKYLTFIHMMYNGIKIKSFSFNPNCKLYRGAKFDQKEIDNLELSIKNKSSNFPSSIFYCKSFLSFSKNKEIAKTFIKKEGNGQVGLSLALIIIEEFTEGAINCPGCADIKKFSLIKKEEEILVFPFTCFEVKNIEKKEDKDINKTYYIIHLDYLGKYEEKFNGKVADDLIEEIPEESLYAQQVFSTDIIDGKYKEKFFKKKSEYVDNNNNNDSVIFCENDIKKEKKNINRIKYMKNNHINIL